MGNIQKILNHHPYMYRRTHRPTDNKKSDYYGPYRRRLVSNIYEIMIHIGISIYINQLPDREKDANH